MTARATNKHRFTQGFMGMIFSQLDRANLRRVGRGGNFLSSKAEF
jgi:hypothetical protein